MRSLKKQLLILVGIAALVGMSTAAIAGIGTSPSKCYVQCSAS